VEKAFLTMAAEIKNTISKQPTLQAPGKKVAIDGGGQDVAQTNSGCC